MANQFCPKCGDPLQPNWNYCTKCGATAHYRSAPKKSLSKIILIIIGSLIGIALLYFIVVALLVTYTRNNSSNDSRNYSANEIPFKIYEEKHHLYSIKYPADWRSEQPKANAVMFSGKKGTPSFYSIVTIEAVVAKKQGGKYNSTEEAAENLKNQITQSASDVTLLEEGEAKIPANLKGFHGQYFVATYTYKGIPVKNVQFIIGRDDKVFYSWGYTSKVNQYDRDLPTAKAMYESWNINPLQR